ncbi:MAG: hypothetical protein PWP51_1581 [Clostridiales bacterium]|nr:hypothetical protein [Clostridiales bacterium]MDN5299028.1 hypothetical protein [Clostridiales bacterium]
MIEEELLDRTLMILEEQGAAKAYRYLLSNLHLLNDASSQVYNFLYCLAAVTDKKEAAINWMTEAIEVKKMWYRPEVFEDEDLDSIRDDERFKRLEATAYERYLSAKAEAAPLFTRKETKAEKLMVVLHGNQQNNAFSQYYWSEIPTKHYQIEYFQSATPDSYQLFRWEDDDESPKQLADAMKYIQKDIYQSIVLGGFSAGCNTLLRCLVETDTTCDQLILQSPWIPVVDRDLERIIKVLQQKNVKLLIGCGKDDADCYPQCLKFEKAAKRIGYHYEKRYFEALGHAYPDSFKEIIQAFLL